MADAELIRALSDLTLAVRGGLQMTTRAATASDVFVPFSDTGTVTGTTALDVWDPGAGSRFVLRGGYITAVVSTAMGGADEGTLNFIDSGSGKVIAPIGSFAAAAAAGTIVSGTSPLHLDLDSGVRGSALAAKVQIKASLDIVGGKFALSGILWGVVELR